MHFEERKIAPNAEPILEDSLKEGEVYFSVQYGENELLTPRMEPLVFAGEYVGSDGLSRLRFQDVWSYRKGVRHDSNDSSEASFQSARRGHTNHIFEYDRALDELMRCALRRKKARGSQ